MQLVVSGWTQPLPATACIETVCIGTVTRGRAASCGLMAHSSRVFTGAFSDWGGAASLCMLCHCLVTPAMLCCILQAKQL